MKCIGRQAHITYEMRYWIPLLLAHPMSSPCFAGLLDCDAFPGLSLVCVPGVLLFAALKDSVPLQ